MNIFNNTRRRLVMQTAWVLSAWGAHESPRDALCCGSSLRPPRRSMWRTAPTPSCRRRCWIMRASSRSFCVSVTRTDNGYHESLYDLVLDSAHRFDPFVEHLWQTIQSLPQY